MIKIKKFLLKLRETCPALINPIISILRFLRFYFYYKPLFLIAKLRRAKKDIDKVFWINPIKIKWSCRGKISLKKDRGKIINGNWDLHKEKFKKNITYQGIKNVFLKQKKWKETNLYKIAKNKIKKGEIFQGCYNEKALESYFKGIETLYESIKEKGFLFPPPKFNGKADPYCRKIDQIKISIDRNGIPLFNDGVHRLSISKILKLKKIPVTIIVRHKKWNNFKKELKTYAQKSNGKLYQKPYHFDLKEITYSYGEERFNLIKNNLITKKGRVLDIGANLGYFCHKFEKIGFRSTAVEINPQDVYFMKKLKKSNEDKFKVVRKSIFNYKPDQELKFDVVLALNIFHHFLKDKNSHKKLIELLHRIKAKEMFLGVHSPEEKQMRGAYKNYKSSDFVKFIKKHSELKKHLLLKKFSNGRKLYKFYL